MAHGRIKSLKIDITKIIIKPKKHFLKKLFLYFLLLFQKAPENSNFIKRPEDLKIELAKSQVKQYNDEAALNLLTEALSIDPTRFDALLWKAEIFMRSKQFNACIVYLRRARNELGRSSNKSSKLSNRNQIDGFIKIFLLEAFYLSGEVIDALQELKGCTYRPVLVVYRMGFYYEALGRY